MFMSPTKGGSFPSDIIVVNVVVFFPFFFSVILRSKIIAITNSKASVPRL